MQTESEISHLASLPLAVLHSGVKLNKFQGVELARLKESWPHLTSVGENDGDLQLTCVPSRLLLLTPMAELSSHSLQAGYV